MLDAGLGPSGPVAITFTVYAVPGLSPLKVTAGVALVTMIGAPPSAGVAMNVYFDHGPAVVGEVAVAVPWVGPVAKAEVRVGESTVGILSLISADAGLRVLEVDLATTDTSYVVPGNRPPMAQLVGVAHVTVTGAPPPCGTAVKV